jgi:hypothetical protein
METASAVRLMRMVGLLAVGPEQGSSQFFVPGVARASLSRLEMKSPRFESVPGEAH